MDQTTVTQTPIHTTESRVDPATTWHPVTRVGFRFAASYFSLYVLTTQMLYALLPFPIPSPGGSALVQNLTTKIATDLLGFRAPLVTMSGSGDKPFDWALALWLLTTAIVITIGWSVLDRRRVGYVTAHQWFRLFLRFSVGASLLSYGMAKVFPNQMPSPQLARLVEPYGHFSLMGVLWQQMGASAGYERFTGIVESLAGVFLFVPRLTLLGSMLALAATTQVFLVNMTYDIPVKLFSFHLVMMCLVLLAPDLRRLANVLLLNRVALPSVDRPLLRNRTARRVAAAAQLALALWLVWNSADENRQAYKVRGPNGPKPPLYGIWTIETMRIDGVTRAPLVTDYDRWRRMIVQTAAGLTFQRMDDTFVTFLSKVDSNRGIIVLSNGGPYPAIPTLLAPPTTEAAGQLRYVRSSAEQVVLEGELTGKTVQMELRRFDHTVLRLLQNRFHWVQDYPFNR